MHYPGQHLVYDIQHTSYDVKGRVRVVTIGPNNAPDRNVLYREVIL